MRLIFEKDENRNPLTIPGYSQLIPTEEFINLVPKNNTLKGVNVLHLNGFQSIGSRMKRELDNKEKMMNNLKRRRY